MQLSRAVRQWVNPEEESEGGCSHSLQRLGVSLLLRHLVISS